MPRRDSTGSIPARMQALLRKAFQEATDSLVSGGRVSDELCRIIDGMDDEEVPDCLESCYKPFDTKKYGSDVELFKDDMLLAFKHLSKVRGKRRFIENLESNFLDLFLEAFPEFSAGNGESKSSDAGGPQAMEKEVSSKKRKSSTTPSIESGPSLDLAEATSSINSGNRFATVAGSTPLVANKKVALKTILGKLSKLENADIFLYPVDKSLYPEYYEFTKFPVDISLVKSNVNNGTYEIVEHALGDIRLIWENCRAFNAEGSQINAFADTLANAFEDLVEEHLGAEFRVSQGGKKKTRKSTTNDNAPDNNMLLSTKTNSHDKSSDAPSTASKPNKRDSKKMDSKLDIIVPTLKSKSMEQCSEEIPTSSGTSRLKTKVDNPGGPLLKARPRRDLKEDVFDDYVARIENLARDTKWSEKGRDRKNLRAVIMKLEKEHYSSPFLFPVNLDDAPGYLDFVKEPMDLSTLSSNLYKGNYDGKLIDFVRDTLKISDNCLKYNDPDSDISSWAQLLAQTAEDLISDLIVAEASAQASAQASTQASTQASAHISAPVIVNAIAQASAPVEADTSLTESKLRRSHSDRQSQAGFRSGLSDEQRAKMYEAVKFGGKTQKEVAEEYGIDPSTVSRVIHQHQNQQQRHNNDQSMAEDSAGNVSDLGRNESLMDRDRYVDFKNELVPTQAAIVPSRSQHKVERASSQETEAPIVNIPNAMSYPPPSSSPSVFASFNSTKTRPRLPSKKSMVQLGLVKLNKGSLGTVGKYLWDFLADLMDLDLADPFRYPMNEDRWLPEYETIVTNPEDFTHLRNKLDYYQEHPLDFLTQLDLIFTNKYRYFHPGHDYYLKAIELQKVTYYRYNVIFPRDENGAYLLSFKSYNSRTYYKRREEWHSNEAQMLLAPSIYKESRTEEMKTTHSTSYGGNENLDNRLSTANVAINTASAGGGNPKHDVDVVVSRTTFKVSELFSSWPLRSQEEIDQYLLIMKAPNYKNKFPGFKEAALKLRIDVIEKLQPLPAKLTLVPGLFEITDFGQINPGIGFHNERCVYPVGYKCKRNLKIALAYSDAASPKRALFSIDVVSTILAPPLGQGASTNVLHNSRLPRFVISTESGVVIAESTLSPYTVWAKLIEPEMGHSILNLMYAKLRRARAVLNRLIEIKDLPASFKTELLNIQTRFENGSYNHEYDFGRDIYAMIKNDVSSYSSSKEIFLNSFETLFLHWVLNVKDKSIDVEKGPWDDWVDRIPYVLEAINHVPADKAAMSKIYASSEFKTPASTSPVFANVGILHGFNTNNSTAVLQIPSWEPEFLKEHIYSRTFEMVSRGCAVQAIDSLPNAAQEQERLLHDSSYLVDFKLEHIPSQTGFFALDLVDIRLRFEITMDQKAQDFCHNYKSTIEEATKVSIVSALIAEKEQCLGYEDEGVGKKLATAIQGERWVWERLRMRPKPPKMELVHASSGHKEGFAPLFPPLVSTSQGEVLICIWDFLDAISATNIDSIEKLENVYSFQEVVQSLLIEDCPGMVSMGQVIFDEIGTVFAGFLFSDLRVSYQFDLTKWWYISAGYPLNILTWTSVAHRAITLSERFGYTQEDAILLLETGDMSSHIVSFEAFVLFFSHPAYKSIHLKSLSNDSTAWLGCREFVNVLREIHRRFLDKEISRDVNHVVAELRRQLDKILSTDGYCEEVKTASCILFNWLNAFSDRIFIARVKDKSAFDESVIISTYPSDPLEDYVLLPRHMSGGKTVSDYSNHLKDLEQLERSLSLLKADKVSQWTMDEKINVFSTFLSFGWRSRGFNKVAHERNAKIDSIFQGIDGIPAAPTKWPFMENYDDFEKKPIARSSNESDDSGNSMVTNDVDDSVITCHISHITSDMLKSFPVSSTSETTWVSIPLSSLELPSAESYAETPVDASSGGHGSRSDSMANSESSSNSERRVWVLENVLKKMGAAREAAQRAKLDHENKGEKFPPFLTMPVMNFYAETGWKSAKTINLRSAPLGYDRYGRQYWLLNAQETQTLFPFGTYTLRDLIPNSDNVLDLKLDIDPAVLVKEPDGWWGFHNGQNLDALIDTFDTKNCYEKLLKENMTIRLTYARGKLINFSHRPRPAFSEWYYKRAFLEKAANDLAKRPLPSAPTDACKHLELVYGRLCEVRMQAHYASLSKHDFDINSQNTKLERDALSRKIRRLKEVHQDDANDFHPGKGWLRMDYLSGVRALACCTTASRLHADINYVVILREASRRCHFKQHWLGVTFKVVEEYMHIQNKGNDDEEEGEAVKEASKAAKILEPATSMEDGNNTDLDVNSIIAAESGNEATRENSTTGDNNLMNNADESNNQKENVVDENQDVLRNLSKEISEMRNKWPNMGIGPSTVFTTPIFHATPNFATPYRPLPSVISSSVIVEPKLLLLKSQMLNVFLALPEKLLKWPDEVVSQSGAKENEMDITANARAGESTNSTQDGAIAINGEDEDPDVAKARAEELLLKQAEEKAERKKKRRERRKLAYDRVLLEVKESTTPSQLMSALLFIESAIPYSWFLDYNKQMLPSHVERVTISALATRLFAIDRLLRYDEIPGLESVPSKISIRPRVNFVPKCFVSSNCRSFMCHPGKCSPAMGVDETASRVFPVSEPHVLTFSDRIAQPATNVTPNSRSITPYTQASTRYRFDNIMTQQQFNANQHYTAYNFNYFLGTGSGSSAASSLAQSTSNSRSSGRKKRRDDDDDDDDDDDIDEDDEEDELEENPHKRVKSAVNIDFQMPLPPLSHLIQEFDTI